MFWPFSESAAIRGLETRLYAEQTAHEATRRELRVVEAERDALAAVVARDRARVAAETAEFARRRADAEGVTSERTR